MVAQGVVPDAINEIPTADSRQGQAAQLFSDDLAAAQVPSVRVIRARLDVGQTRA